MKQLRLPRVALVLLALACALLLTGERFGRNAIALAAAAPLIPRKVLFGNPERAAVQLSPDGAQLSFLAPVDGVLNVWVGPLENPDAAVPVTKDTRRGVRVYFWAYTSEHIVYLQDKEGDENWRVHVVDLESGRIRDLTPLEGVRAEIEEVSHKFPKRILIGLNDRDPQYHDIHELDLVTGERKLVLENPGFAGFITDDDFRIRFAQNMTEDGGEQYFKRTGEGGWEPFLTIGMTDSLTTYIAGFDKSGDSVFMVDSLERNTAALTRLDLETGEKELIAGDDRADLSGLMRHPTEKTVQAVAFNYLRKEWEFMGPAVQRDIAKLREIEDGEISVTSRTLDDSGWIAAFLQDDGPVRYYHLDRNSGEPRFLFVNRPELTDQPLVPMTPLVIPSRDGYQLVSYLSLPPNSDRDGDGRPSSPLPMVLYVHGGPWTRDVWGYHPDHQWFANRGYAVLSVNYRGSVGFGKEFLNAGNLEWGAKMHDDLIDAVDWAIDEAIADPERVAIYGGSYGGYAALAGLTFTPETFACGVSIVGPSSLITLLNSIPPYWAPRIKLFTMRVGDHTTEEGREFLESRSPLTHVGRIERPLLIGQGANDPRVKQAESDQIVEAMQSKGIPVTYVLFSDEGHGFARPENRLSFAAVAEAFLAEHLGGRFQPVGDAFDDSSIAVPAGAGDVPALEAALAAQQAE